MIDIVESQRPVKARSLLAESPITELRYLEVSEQGDYLLISGKVRSFYHKQLAQETVRQVASGMHVVNRVDVQ